MMGGSSPRNVARAALAAVVLACLGAAVALPAYSTLWLAAAGATSVVALGEIGLRRKRRHPRPPSEDPPERDERAEATNVTVPWRSSPFWQDFDLSVGAGRLTDWFSFEGGAGDPIAVTAEAAPGGPGVFVSLFGPGDDGPLVEALSDERGRAMVTASARTSGVHHVRVRAWARTASDSPQKYRLSIAGPFRAGRTEVAHTSHGGYADVPLWHPYHDAIQRVTVAGLMSGRQTEGGFAFGPDRPLWEAEFIEILGRYLDERADGADGPLRRWGESALAVGSAADPASETTRARVLALTVDAVEHAFPGLLVPPPEPAGETDGWEDPRRTRRREIADYNGLLAGIESFATDAGLESAVTRGEMARLLDSVIQIVEGGTAWSDSHEAAPWTSGPIAGRLAAWDAMAGTEAEFIANATAAIDVLGALESSEAAEDAPHDAAVEALHATIAAMRRDNAARSPGQRRPAAAEPTTDPTRVDPPAGLLAPRVPESARVDPRRVAGRRVGRRVSRWTRPF